MDVDALIPWDLPTGIASLAPEVLEEVVSYLLPVDQRTVMSTSKVLHDVTARQLYRHIKVSAEMQGFRLLETLVWSKAGYAAHPRTLHYGGRRVYYSHDFHVLLVKALGKLERLTYLSLDVRPVHFFDAPSNGIDFGLDRPINRTPAWSRPRSLHTFRLHGDMRLLVVNVFRTVTELSLANELNRQGLEALFDAIAPAGQNTVLTNLQLTLDRSADESRINSTIYKVSGGCPNIETLALRAPKVNALETSQILALEYSVLPNLHELSINKVSYIPPLFPKGRKHLVLERQHTHLEAAGALRPRLAHVTFGAVQWTRTPDSNTWTVNTRRVTDVKFDDLERFPEGSGILPEFWCVYYSDH